MLTSLHTTLANKAMAKQKKNGSLDDLSPSTSNNKASLSRKKLMTLSQLRSGHCKLLGQYKKGIGKDATNRCCPDCGAGPRDILHLFNCSCHPTETVRFVEQHWRLDLKVELSRREKPGVMTQQSRNKQQQQHQQQQQQQFSYYNDNLFPLFWLRCYVGSLYA